MTIPNLGVTQIIPQQGPLGIAAQGLGGLGQLMMQVEQAKQEKAKNDAYNAYMEELTTASRTGRESSAAAAAAAKRDAEARAQVYGQVLDGLGANGALQPGEIAALRLMDPTEGTKKVLEMFGPMKLGGTERLVNPRGGDGGAPVVTMGVDTTPPPVTRPGDVAEAMEVALGLPRDTPIASLTPEQRQTMDQYINRKVATGAPRSSVSIAADTFASGVGKAAGDKIARTELAASDAARDLELVGQLQGLLREGMITGAGANAMTAVGNALAQFGIGGDNVSDPVARTQAYSALVGQRVGSIIKQFGSGTGLSDADRKYAERIAGGQISLTPEALQRIFTIADKQNRWVIGEHNRSIDRLPVGDDVKETLRVPLPQSSAPQSQQFMHNGKVITGTLDPVSGKYRAIVGGRLVNLN